MGGTLSAAAMILALIGGGSAQSSAFGYFLTAAVITLLAVMAYLALWHLVRTFAIVKAISTVVIQIKVCKVKS